MPRYSIPEYYETLEDALMQEYTVPVLKRIYPLLLSNENPIRKSEIVSLICNSMKSHEGLHGIWQRMCKLEQDAISEIVHSSENQLDNAKFVSKYGQLPNVGRLSEYDKGKPSLINLIIINGIMPEELKGTLKVFAPKPHSHTITTREDIDDSITRTSNRYDHENNKYVDVDEEIPIVKLDTQRPALQDVLSVLRIIDSGKINVSNKTMRTTEAGARTIATILEHGDYYLSGKDSSDNEIGFIKAFAWPLIVQSAKLAELSGSKLKLTKQGQKALNLPPHEVIWILWDKWLKTKIIDEFNRIDNIKGQKGKGKRGLTALLARRACVANTLALCPVGKWISVENFFRAIRALDNNFEVTQSEWSLYICEARYGSLGYDNMHKWEIVQGRYALAFLFEYAATMGIIDVAYTPPSNARDDYHGLWGVDDLDFLSRYDGLLYIRVNPLGAWCLEISESYKAAPIEKRCILKVLPNREITEILAPFPHADALFLEAIADKISDKVWRLNTDKILITYEKGRAIEEIKEFLLSKGDHDLPGNIITFFDDMIRRSKLLSDVGMARLVKVSDPMVALTLTKDSRLKDLCISADGGHIIVPVANENEFRKKLRKMGYSISFSRTV